jgi:hypothetical protein
MKIFMPVFSFALMLTLLSLPVYIAQLLITKFAGVQYRFILPIISAIICLIFSLMFILRLNSVESAAELFRRLILGVTILVSFQIPTLLLLLVGHLTTKLAKPNYDIEKMKHLDLE